MNRFIFVSLLVMAWGYWELSGGAGFVAQERPAAAVALAPVAAPVEEIVTRADTSELNQLDMPLIAEPALEPAEVAVTEPVVTQEVTPIIETPVAAPASTGATDLRVVTGNRVNLRDGPGTGFAAVDQLVSGTIAEVVEIDANGWVRVQVQGSSQSGWMSGDFLIPLNG